MTRPQTTKPEDQADAAFIRAGFDVGLDTHQMAQRLNLPEAEVYRLLSKKDQEGKQ